MTKDTNMTERETTTAETMPSIAPTGVVETLHGASGGWYADDSNHSHETPTEQARCAWPAAAVTGEGRWAAIRQSTPEDTTVVLYETREQAVQLVLDQTIQQPTYLAELLQRAGISVIGLASRDVLQNAEDDT